MKPSAPHRTSTRRYIDRVIVGTAVEVANAVSSMVERGRLVSMTVPHPVPGGRVAVKVRMLAPTPRHRTAGATARPPTGRRTDLRHLTGPVAAGLRGRWAGMAAAVVGAVVLLAGMGYAVFLLIRELWPLLLAIAVVLFWLRRKLPCASHKH